MRRAAVIPMATLLASVLSGCVLSGEPEEPTDPDGVGTLGFTWLGLTATKCVGAFATSTWPENVGPLGDETPPGWEPAGNAGWDYFVQLYICENVSWGQFERGPVGFLFEYHNHQDTPDSCFGNGPQSEAIAMRTMVSTWISDKQVADNVSLELGMPVRSGPISRAVEMLPSQDEEVTWTWGLEGQQQSYLSWIQPGSFTPGSPNSDWNRLFWHNGTAVSYVDLHETYVLRGSQLFLGGKMYPPMQYAESGIHDNPGAGGVFHSVELGGTIRRFKDLQCEEPL